MVQFAHLAFAGIRARLLQAIPLVGRVLLRLTRLAVADTPRPPCSITKNLGGHGRIHAARRAARIGHRKSVADPRHASILARRLPLPKVARVALDSERFTGSHHRFSGFRMASSLLFAPPRFVAMDAWLYRGGWRRK